jgi:hypothetical protein
MTDALTDALEHLRHVRVLESQVEGNKEVVAALRELEENLVARIDDSAEETTALAEIALTRIEELREILLRLEHKIDALATRLPSREGAGCFCPSASRASMLLSMPATMSMPR